MDAMLDRCWTLHLAACFLASSIASSSRYQAAAMDDCWSAYVRGVIHGLLLMLPVAGFLYRRWTQAAARASLKQPDDKQPTLGCVRAAALYGLVGMLTAAVYVFIAAPDEQNVSGLL